LADRRLEVQVELVQTTLDLELADNTVVADTVPVMTNRSGLRPPATSRAAAIGQRCLG
jgi:hypothetical protein